MCSLFWIVCVCLIELSFSDVRNRYINRPTDPYYGGIFPQFYGPQPNSGCQVTIAKALCKMRPNPSLGNGLKAHGNVRMTEERGCGRRGFVHFIVDLHGFPKENTTLHGFAVHVGTDFSLGCESFGPHFDLEGHIHGSPKDPLGRRHLGDLGNVIKEHNGKMYAEFYAPEGLTLIGSNSIIGHGLVIHMNPDDFGRKGDEESLRTGNTGMGLACCVIEPST